MGAENTVTIALKTRGINSARNGLLSLRDTLVQIDQQATAAASAGSKKRIEIAKSEAKARAKIAKDLDKTFGPGGSPATDSLAPTTRQRKSRRGGSEDDPLKKAMASVEADRAARVGMLQAGIAGAAFGALVKGIDMATNAISQFGGFLLNDIAKPSFALEKFATQLENSSGGSVKAQEVMDKSRAIQARWNIDAMEAAQAAATIADKTGDMKVAFDAINNNAMLSQGYGAGMGELGELSAAIFNLDQKMGKEGLQKAMFTQLAQGQVAGGRFTIKDIAGLGGELVKNASRLSGDADVRLASIGAALQTGGITGKADVSMTNLNSFIAEAGSKLKDSGVVNKQGQVTDLGAAIRAALVKTGGDAGKLKTMGFSDTSTSFLMQYMGDFQAALQRGAKAADAAAGATSVFEKMRQAVADEGTVRAAANKVMMTSGERVQSAMNAIKDKLYSLMPQISALANSLANKAPQLASAAMTLAKVFLALGSVLEKLIPETDTRTKRAFEREQQKMKAAEAAEKTGKELDAADAEIAKIRESGSAGEKMHRLPALEAKRKALADRLSSQEDALRALDEPEKATTREEAAAAIAKDKDFMKAFLSTPALAGAAHVTPGQGTDAENSAKIADYIAKMGGEFDFGNWNVGSGTRGVLEKYRDEQLEKQEKTISDGAQTGITDKFAGIAESLTKAANSLQDAADAQKDAAKGTPLGNK